MSKLLTIAIPTYNRASFLKNCLYSIWNQWQSEMNELVEILVSNNASTDDTHLIVNELIALGMPIKYIENSINLGADKNICQCLEKATAKYVQILGDDDCWVNGALIQCLQLLQKNNYGLIFIQSKNYKDDFCREIPQDTKTLISTYTNSVAFLKRISLFITFISANIINKSLLPPQFEGEKFCGTSLAQIHWYLSAVSQSQINLYIHSAWIGAKLENSGGYKLFKVFGEGFASILEYHQLHQQLSKQVVDKIHKDLLTRFFPPFIKNLQSPHSKQYIQQFEVDYQETLKIFHTHFSSDLSFKIYTKYLFHPKPSWILKLYCKVYERLCVILPRQIFNLIYEKK